MPLPPGLLLNPQTGELTGVPTVAGVYAIQLKVSDAIGTSRELTDSVTINPYTPQSWSGSLGSMMANRAATHITVASTGGIGPYTYSVYSGALPDGLTLDTSTGAISGAPTTPGGYAAMLRVVDSVGGQADYLIAGTVAVELTMIYGGDGIGTVGVAENDLLAVNGGTAPYTYSVVAALPPGLAFAAARITGTPTAASSVTSTLRVVDAGGFVTDTVIAWDIAVRPTITGINTHGTVGRAFSASLVGSGGHTPYTYAWSGAGTVNGLSLDPNTGAISGTPVNTTQVSLTATVTDSQGVVSASSSIIIALHAALTIGGGYAASVPLNAAFNFAPSVAGGWTPYTYAISAGALPTGVSLNTSTGVISGTCNTPGVYTATLRVTDADSNTATMAVNVTVASTLAMTGGVTNFATASVAYSGSTLAGSQGTAPYSFSVSVGALPPGLVLNTSTGAITGTPTGNFGAGVTYNFTIKLSDANNSFVNSNFSITVADFPSIIGDMPDGSTSVAYAYAYAASGGHQPLTYSVNSGALPTGLSLNTSTGVVSGTPSAIGTYNFVIRVVDNHGNAFNHVSDQVVIYSGVTLSGTLTAHAEIGDFYSSGLTSSIGGRQPYNWTVEGTLPGNLTIDAGTGVISGTPVIGRTTPGAYTFTVRVTDSLGRTNTSQQTITVAAAVRFVSGYAAGGTAGFAYDSTPPVVADGWTAYSFAGVGGTLPGGTSLNTSTGAISGTLSAAATYNFTIRVTDSLGVTASIGASVVVAAAVGISGVPAYGTVGIAYGFQPARTGGWGPFAYSISAGALPPGININSSTGALTGTPTAVGTYNFTIRVLDTSVYGGSSATVACTIQTFIYPTLTTNYPRGEVGYAYSGTVSVTGGQAPLTYSRVAGALPPGLVLNASTGALSGTPTTVNTYNPTIRVTDAQGNISDSAPSIQIAGQLTNTSNFPDGRQGVAYSAQAGSTGGWAPKTYSLASGTLPTGLTLSSAGLLSGTPSAAGTYVFVVRVTDADAHTATSSSQSVVIAAPTASLSASANPNPATTSIGTGGHPTTGSVSSTVTAAGGTAPYSYAWSFISGSGSGAALTISHSTVNSIQASALNDGIPEYDRTEIWRCTVTDNVGATAFVNVTLEIDIAGTQ